MPRLASLLALVVASAIPAPSPAAEPARAPSVQFNVTYATVDGEKLQLDLALPATPGPHPCVVCLHGGAWRMGSRRDLSRPGSWADCGFPGKSLLEVLADRGFAAASVSYRLAPRSKFPAQIQDARTAVRYLRTNADKLGIDPARIGAMGFSAGGHLASLLGTADDTVTAFDTDLYPGQSNRVACVVDFFGPSDLSLYGATPGVEKVYFVPLLGGPLAEKPELYRRASPIDYVTKDDPPFLIVHGTADVIVPMIHSERLHDKLVKAGVKAELLAVKGKGHGWFGEPAMETTESAIKFLNANMPAKGK